MTMAVRPVVQRVAATRTVEGGGFVVRRPFPTRELALFDPFLLLDEMGPVDYAPGQAVGAPDHPHRGFETVTYLLEGEFEHEDSAGNRGRLAPGDLQWMTAGRGVVHSEMPSERVRRDGGRVHGFQVWVNLPARDKMTAPRYQDVSHADLPIARTPDGLVTVKVVAGNALGVAARVETRTPILYFDVTIEPGGAVALDVPKDFNVAVYVFDGALRIAGGEPAPSGTFAVLGDGDQVALACASDARAPARALVLGGVPLREPVARYGPFVMNTDAEIHQAIDDFRSGRFGDIAR
ncbi:MAG TPA: pirin family protein [Casimicrobiaceae bacterium]